MLDLALQLSQLAIEPIEVVSAPTTPNPDLERLLMDAMDQSDAPSIVKANICSACGGCAGDCFPECNPCACDF